jgi:glycosyltransferase involved in cell wall biosynthesis
LPADTDRREAIAVWQVYDSLAVSYGGISATAASLANHLAAAGARVVAVSLDADRHGPTWPLDPSVDAVRAPAAWNDALGFRRALAARFPSLAPPQIVHLHGLWRGHFAQASRYARAAGAPVIVSVHGMLHPPALRQRSALKRIARLVYQDEVLRTAHCLHATAVEEAHEIRALGLDRPIAVIPWGVDMPDGDHVRRVVDESSDRERVLLFLGRLHPTKGLEPLLRAWTRVFRQFPSWRLLLAGYDDVHYGATLKSIAVDEGLGESVRFVGPVDGADRDRLFDRADVLVLPSPSENFGLVVPEALGRGVPVIATEGAPWSSLRDERCGWWIPVGADALAATLTDALGRSPAELRAMGERGRTFARTRFAWRTVTHSMLDLYAWARGVAPRPAFVQN